MFFFTRENISILLKNDGNTKNLQEIQHFIHTEFLIVIFTSYNLYFVVIACFVDN